MTPCRCSIRHEPPGLNPLPAGGLLYQLGWRWTNLASALLLALIQLALIRNSHPTSDTTPER